MEPEVASECTEGDKVIDVDRDRQSEVSSQEETGILEEGMEPVDEGLSMMGQTTFESPTGWRMHIPSSRWTDGVLPQQRTHTHASQ